MGIKQLYNDNLRKLPNEYVYSTFPNFTMIKSKKDKYCISHWTAKWLQHFFPLDEGRAKFSVFFVCVFFFCFFFVFFSLTYAREKFLRMTGLLENQDYEPG